MQDKWQRVSLEYIADVIDPQPDHRAPRFVEGGFSYIGIGDIDPDGHIRHEECRKVSEAAVAKQERAFIIEYEDIAFGKVGTVGKVVYLKEQGRYAVSATLVIIKPKDNVDRHFLFHLLQSHQTAENIVYRQTGTTRATLGIQQIRNFEYFIPLLIAEQKRIAEILDTLDEAIAHTSCLITKLKHIKAGLLNDLLTRGLDENGELRDAIAHPEQFKDSPLGRIPKDWEAKSLAAIADLQVGFAFKSEWFQEQEGIKLLRGENVGYSKPDWSEIRTLPWSMYPKYREYQLVIGDIIVGMDRTFTKSGFKISVLEQEDLPALLVQRVGRFLPIYCERQFLKIILTSPQYHKALLTKQKGMDIPHLSKMEILEPVVAVPPAKEQICIASLIDAHDTRIRTEQAYLEKLKLQKKGLMHDLLTGKVRVNQVKNNVAILTSA